jgi:opacity protein-like surface antigen
VTLHNLDRVGVIVACLTAGACMEAQAADQGAAKGVGYTSASLPAQWDGIFAGADLAGNFSEVEMQRIAGGLQVDLPDNAFAPGALALGRVWQFGPWVAGIEGHVNGSLDNPALAYSKIVASDYGSLRLRSGYALGRMLFYATAGAEFKNRQLVWNSGAPEDYNVNLTAAVGVEYKLDDHWALRAEASAFRAFQNDSETPVTNGVGRTRPSLLTLGLGAKF